MGLPKISPAAQTFIESCAAGIMKELTGSRKEYSVSAYRYDGEYLGFDWRDNEGKGMSFTFCVVGKAELPTHVIGGGGADIDVADMTDALLLCDEIARRVLGAAPAPL